MGRRSVWLVVLLGCAVGWAQPSPGTVVSGTVTGHVMCADTGLPARMASVVLVPVVEPDAPKAKPGTSTSPTEAINVVETMLDGSFVVSRVRPGAYYVVAEKLGYLSPLAQISRDELNHPTQATVDRIKTLLTPVLVAANRNSTAEVRLLRGAAISGEVRFDDGQPAATTSIKLLHKDEAGKWSPFRTRLLSSFAEPKTNDQGQFRFSGLPAGEYLVDVSVELNQTFVSSLFTEYTSSSTDTRYALHVYAGSALRQRDAKAIKLDEGAEASNVLVEIPLSKLHGLSGSVLEAGNGRVVNDAKVSLLYQDDRTELVSTTVRGEDDAFHFDYVPEGEYLLRVTAARDVTREQIPYPPGTFPPTHTEIKALRSFGDAEQPLILHTDTSGVTVAVPPAAGKTP